MTRYRLTPAAARRHPSVDPHQIYTAAGPPDELGVMLNVFPDSQEPKDGPWVLRNPQFFFHQDLELVLEEGEAPPADPPRSIDVPGVSGRQPDGSWILDDSSVERPDSSKRYPPP